MAGRAPRAGRGQGAVVEEEKVKFVIVTLQERLYAFGGADVREILPALEIFPVPGAPGAVPGVVNNRGDIEAVIDLHALLGLPAAEPAAANRVAIAEKGGVRAGLLVDSVVDVVDLPLSSIKPPLATLAETTRDLVAGETTYRDCGVVLLDVGRIFERLRDHDR